MSDPSFREVLSNRNFSRLWFGQIISSIGDRFYQFALLSVILGISQGAGLGKESARVVFCGMLPALLFAPWIGWAVDHYSRKSVMIFSDLVRVVLTLSILYFWFTRHHYAVIFGIIFFMGFMNALFIPARQAALPQIIEPARLVTANALIALIGVIANLVGTIFAGLIVSIFGARSSFMFNAAGFLVSAALIWRIDRPLRPEKSTSPSAGHWHEITAGWRLVHSMPGILLLIFLNGLFSFVSGIFLISVLEYIVVSVDLSFARALAGSLTKFLALFAPKPPVFDIPFLSLGLLLACVGLGLGAGVWFCGKSRKWSHSNALPFLSLFLLGFGLVAFARLETYGPALAGSLVLGFLSAIMVIPIEARLQHEIGDSRRGRVFALRNLWTTVCFLVALGVNLNGYWLKTLGAGQMITALGWGVTGLAAVLSALNARKLTTFWSSQQ
jgi:MFS family permease